MAEAEEPGGLTRWTTEPVDWQDTRGGEEARGVRLSNRDLYKAARPTREPYGDYNLRVAAGLNVVKPHSDTDV